VKIGLDSNWKASRKVLSDTGDAIGPAVQKALKQEGEGIVGLIKKNIQKGPPPPLKHKRMSKEGRGGSKPLNAGGDLRGAVTMIPADGGLFVGIPRNAKGHGGKTYSLAEIHEKGKTIAIRMTPKMRRFLFGVLFRGNSEGPKGPHGLGIIVIHIPARPFVWPAFVETEKGYGERMTARVAAILKL